MDISEKLRSVISLLEEKISRELSLTTEEVKKVTITIKNGQITVKEGKK